MARASPNVFTVPPGSDFCAIAVEALLEGSLLGLRFDAAPLQLADVTLFLPTQRLCREFERVLARRLAPRAAILPRLRPLGEPFEDAQGAEFADEDEAPGKRKIEPAERRFLLLPEIAQWRRALAASARGQAVPEAGIQDLREALGLSDALGRLIDEMAIDEIPLESLAMAAPDGFDPAKFDEYWTLTREFLRLAAKSWPEKCAALNGQDAMQARLAALDAQGARLLAADSQAPIAVLGSTGSVRATARLMRAIARLDHGAVVLPGLDQRLDAAREPSAYALIGSAQAGFATRFAHPQASLKRALAEIGIDRQEVRQLGVQNAAQSARNHLLSEAMRPAESSDLWQKTQGEVDLGRALSGMMLIEAKDDRQEAVAIAILIREALETPGRRIALVTADRGLARRVASEAKRWDIDLADSAPTRLADGPFGTLLALMLRAASEAKAVNLLALLQHPSFRLGFAKDLVVPLREAFEVLVLRGGHFSRASGLMESTLKALDISGRRTSCVAERVPDAIREALPGYARAIEQWLAGLTKPGETSFADQAGQVAAAFEAAIAPGLGETLSEGEAERAAIGRFLGAIGRMGTAIPASPRQAFAAIEMMLAEPVRLSPKGGHPRAAILGLLEARLLAPDRLILGGLNEGSFPPMAESDPFLNRAMRLALGLQPPERRIGQSAHDFSMLAAHPDLVLTRAIRHRDQPGLASRFLRRLEAFAGKTAWEALKARGAPILALAGALDRPGRFSPIGAPEIRPRAPRLPQRLSITQIETLYRNPYAIYAKGILGLEALEALDPPPDARDRGSLLHGVLEAYSRSDPPADPVLAQQRLRDIGADAFRAIAHEPEMHAFWWRTFLRILPGFVAFEAQSRAAGRRIFTEIRGEIDIEPIAGHHLRLSGKADRIERMPDGGLIIIDYKSGMPPTDSAVREGKAPQLPISAALALRGGFAGLPSPAVIEGIGYVPIGGRASVAQRLIKPSDLPLPDLIEAQWQRLMARLAGFAEGRLAYRARALVQPADDYDHLARIREWSQSGGIGDESEGFGAETSGDDIAGENEDPPP